MPELSKPSIRVMRIADIGVQNRSRKDMGNVGELADSVAAIGLLHPIVVTGDSKLIVGARRIAAFKKLGRKTIPAQVVRSLDELEGSLKAESDENTCRKSYTPEEAVQLGLRIEKLEKPAVAARAAEGKKKGGGDKRSAKAKRSRKTFPRAVPDDSTRLTSRAAKVVGMSRPSYEKAKAVVASKDKKLIDDMNRTGRVSGVHKRLVVAQKAKAIKAEPKPLPKGPFRVIVCDPPWKYDRETDVTQRGTVSYPSLSIDDIKRLPVRKCAHKDCILWLWATNAHLPYAFEIATAWGFEYKTMLTWAKQKMGMGDWLRGKTEHCLLCVRGKPTVQLTNQTTLLIANAGKHSAKPEEFYALVEKLCPGSKLEMYQRKARKGWQGWGDEA